MTHPRVSWGGEIQSEQDRTSKEKPNPRQMSKRLYSAWETPLLRSLSLAEGPHPPNIKATTKGLFVERAQGMELRGRIGHIWKME